MPKKTKTLETKEAELHRLLTMLKDVRSKWLRKQLTASILALFGYIHDTPAAKQHWIDQSK